MYTTRGVLVASIIALTVMAPSMRNKGEQVIEPVGLQARFTSVELRSGGKAVIHFGSTYRVTLLKGSPEISRVTVEAGEQLVIDKCRDRCPRGYQLEVEIVSPVIVGISISNGGTIESRGNFPRQEQISLAVRNGGTIDSRSIAANKIMAQVAQGGGIFAKPQTAMVASIVNGGMITYWGDAQVTSSTQHGGQVIRGSAADADKPISDLGSSLMCVPKVPSNQPVQDQ